MTRRRKISLCAGLATTALVAAAFVLLWTPFEEIRLDAMAAGAEQAVRDLHAEYKAAWNGQPAYYGYVIQGPFDTQAVRSRMPHVGVPVLSFDQVRASDWQRERGIQGWGPKYIYLRKDTGQQALVVNVELTRCSRFSAAVRISHDVGGVTYCLSRWPGQPWRVVSKKDAYTVVY